MEVPTTLKEIAEESWQHLNHLADPGGDTPEVHKALDDLRAAYADYYEQAEAITQSSAIAARREGAQERRPAAPAPAAAAALSTADKIAARVPHGVRAKIPPKARRAVRRVLGR
jgi:hypothetical protein